MPAEREAEERISRAERRAFELSEHAIAGELFPNLDFRERAMLVGLRIAQTEHYPDDPDDEEGVIGEMKEMTGIIFWAQKIKESGLIESLDQVQRIIFKERYGNINGPDQV